MAIVPLDTMTLYGAASQKERVLDQLQALGCVHLIDLSKSSGDYVSDDVSTDARDALKYLRACPEQLRQVRRADQFSLEPVVSFCDSMISLLIPRIPAAISSVRVTRRMGLE